MTSVMASNANPPAVVTLDTTASTIPIRHLTPLSGSSNSDWGGRFNQPLAHRPDVSSLRVPATHHAGRPARGARPRGGGIVGGVVLQATDASILPRGPQALPAALTGARKIFELYRHLFCPTPQPTQPVTK